MQRALTILGVLVLVGVGFYLFVWSAVSPEARIAHPYAKRLIEQLKEDPRFTNVTVSVSNGRQTAIAPSVVSAERSAILYDELRE